MVEINNQRKAFPCRWRFLSELDNGRQKTRNHGYDVIVGGELFTDYSDHLAGSSRQTQQPINRRRTLPASFLLVGCLPQAAGLKDFSPKVRTLWHCRLRSGRFTYDWSWWYLPGNRPLQQYLGLPPGAGYGQFEYKADSLIAKFKEAGGTGQRDWCMSRVTAIISALVICIIVCLSWAVNHYRDNAITYKAQRDKNARELEAGERGNYWHADASAWCCCAWDAKYTKELADAKAENDALRDDVAAGRRRLHITVRQLREATTASAWIMQPPRLADTAERDYFTLRERLITIKQLEANLWSILMSSVDRAAHRWATWRNYCEQYTRASSGV